MLIILTVAHAATAKGAAVVLKVNDSFWLAIKNKPHTEMVPDCESATLQRIIKGKTNIESVIHPDGWRGYSGLIDFGYKKHFSVDHGENESVRGDSFINGIGSCWAYAKTRRNTVRGMNKNNSEFHSKQCELGSIIASKVYIKIYL